MKSWLAIVSLGAVAGLGGSAVADDDDRGVHNRGQRVFRAQLSGYSEVPASLSTPARGQFYAILNKEGTELTYWLSYSGFTVTVNQSHIHFGQHHTNGGISAWLCKNPNTTPPIVPTDPVVAGQTPDCQQQGTSSPITATISNADVVGPAGQGIAIGEFAELLAAMRAGIAYVNVHSAAFPGGEIRGQIR
jgi:hypothetical protein